MVTAACSASCTATAGSAFLRRESYRKFHPNPPRPVFTSRAAPLPRARARDWRGTAEGRMSAMAAEHDRTAVRAPVGDKGLLSNAQIEQFWRDGYLVIEDFASEQELKAMMARMDELVGDFEPENISVFSTTNQAELTDQYFYDSASNVSFFFEEKAFDDKGSLTKPKDLAINKVGHALHDLDPVFRSFSRSEKMKALAASLGFVRPLPAQSMYIFKQPHIGGEVVPHQDSTFLYTTPLSCIGIWLAVEDATLENGCLWAIPASHREGVSRRMIIKDTKITFDHPPVEYNMSEFKPLEMRAGSLVVLHGENVHYSAPNTSPISRHAYSMHMIEGKEGFSWAPDNWAQRPPENPWEPLYE